MKGLSVSQVALQAGLHPETVRNLERRGVIMARRDLNGWRRFTPETIDRLKTLYSASEHPQREQQQGEDV